MKYIERLKTRHDVLIVLIAESQARFIASYRAIGLKPYIELGTQLEPQEFALLHELGHKWHFERNEAEFLAKPDKSEVIATLYALHHLFKHRRRKEICLGIKMLNKRWTDGHYKKALEILKARRIWKKCLDLVKET